MLLYDCLDVFSILFNPNYIISRILTISRYTIYNYFNTTENINQYTNQHIKNIDVLFNKHKYIKRKEDLIHIINFKESPLDNFQILKYFIEKINITKKDVIEAQFDFKTNVYIFLCYILPYLDYNNCSYYFIIIKYFIKKFKITKDDITKLNYRGYNILHKCFMNHNYFF